MDTKGSDVAKHNSQRSSAKKSSAEEDDEELTPEEIKKLERIMSVLKGAVYEQQERDEIKDIIEDEW